MVFIWMDVLHTSQSPVVLYYILNLKEIGKIRIQLIKLYRWFIYTIKLIIVECQYCSKIDSYTF